MKLFTTYTAAHALLFSMRKDFAVVVDLDPGNHVRVWTLEAVTRKKTLNQGWTYHLQKVWLESLLAP